MYINYAIHANLFPEFVFYPIHIPEIEKCDFKGQKGGLRYAPVPLKCRHTEMLLYFPLLSHID